MYDQQNLSILDMLEVMAFILQVLDYDATLRQSSNDDVIAELHRQSAAFLDRIEKTERGDDWAESGDFRET